MSSRGNVILALASVWLAFGSHLLYSWHLLERAITLHKYRSWNHTQHFLDIKPLTALVSSQFTPMLTSNIFDRTSIKELQLVLVISERAVKGWEKIGFFFTSHVLESLSKTSCCDAMFSNKLKCLHFFVYEFETSKCYKDESIVIALWFWCPFSSF